MSKKIYVKVKPNSGKQEIVEFGEFRYLIYLKSPPENDKANIELINLMSKHLGVPAKTIYITFGRISNDKIIDVRF